MSCEKCNDTGSLSKHLDGMLDCPYCPAADQRIKLADWHKMMRHEHHPIDLLWLAIQHDREINQGEKK